MTSSSRKTKSALLIMWAFVLSSMTFVLGGVPLNGLYRSMGRTMYWIFWPISAVLVFLVGFYGMAIGILLISLVIGLFNEVRRRGYPLIVAGFIAVSFTSFLSFLGAFFWAKYNQIRWSTYFENYINDNIVKYMPQANNNSFSLDIQQLVMQIPSAGVIVLILSLFLAVVFERRVLTWLKIPCFQREQLFGFKLPEPTIWLFIFSVFATFFKTERAWINMVGLNVLNIVAILYFFQGLAVISYYLKITKTSPFWQTLIYLFAILQLFIAVVLLGVLDYWFDFREKMKKKAAEIKTYK